MTGTLTLDDIDIVRDSNGNLVIRDDTDTTVATYDTTANEWQFADNIDLSANDLLNAATANADVVTIDDTATSPSTAGEFRLNGTDIEAYTGGGVKNLSNISSGLSGVTNASNYSGTNGGAQIQAAIDDANAAAGNNVVYVPPVGPDDASNVTGVSESNIYVLTSPLSVPSDTTLIFDNCYLALADNTDDNLLHNANAYSGDSTRDENIHILGWGMPRLHGNANNQTRLSAQQRNNGINLHKVDNWTIQNIDIGPTNSWAISPENTTNGHADNIYFSQDDSTDNQDGIHITGPGNSVQVSHLRGQTGDDMVAVESAGASNALIGSGGNMTDVTVSDVIIENLDVGGVLRTVPGDGTQLRNITMTNVYVQGSPTPASGDGYGIVKLGWNGASTQPAESEHENITITGIHGETTTSGHFIRQESPVRNVTISDATGSVGSDLWNNTYNQTAKSYSSVEVSNWNVSYSGSGFKTDFKIDGQYVQSSTPSSPELNDEWLDTGNGVTKWYDGSSFQSLGGGGTLVTGDTATASGDGSTTTFTLSISHGQLPKSVSVDPESADAAGTYWISNKTSSSVDVTYSSAPASGTDNLSWSIASVGQGSTTTVIDDFEDQDIAEYAGDTGSFSVGTTNVQNGSYSLSGTASTGGGVSIASTSGLPAYPSSGDTVRVWARTGTNTSAGRIFLNFSAQSETAFPNGYYVRLDRDVGEFQLRLRDGAGDNALATAAQSYSDSTYYEVEFDWQDPIVATLFDGTGSQLNQVSASDATYSSGGVAWGVNPASGDQTAWFDYCRIV